MRSTNGRRTLPSEHASNKIENLLTIDIRGLAFGLNFLKSRLAGCTNVVIPMLATGTPWELSLHPSTESEVESNI